MTQKRCIGKVRLGLGERSFRFSRPGNLPVMFLFRVFEVTI